MHAYSISFSLYLFPDPLPFILLLSCSCTIPFDQLGPSSEKHASLYAFFVLVLLCLRYSRISFSIISDNKRVEELNRSDTLAIASHILRYFPSTNLGIARSVFLAVSFANSRAITLTISRFMRYAVDDIAAVHSRSRES